MPRSNRGRGSHSILETRVTYFRRSLFRGIARLFQDRIEVSSIVLSGVSRQRILLDQLSDVKADSAIGGKSLYLEFKNGETVRLELVRGAALWDLKIKECLGRTGVNGHSLRNRRAADRVARESAALSDSRPAVHDGFSKSGNSVWSGGGGYSPDHPPVQLPSASEN
ncbi:MAG: hypothetical protein KDD65_14350 [Bacteroidetes bacterium]|nr:hypothetical protein [Bacteroidota bacterium]